MIAKNGRNYEDLPHFTEGDEGFRSKFLSWDLGDLTFVDIQEYLKEKDLIIVPMASLEQHGPHLPLYTDTITAIEMSRRVSEIIAVLHTPPWFQCESDRPGTPPVALRDRSAYRLRQALHGTLLWHPRGSDGESARRDAGLALERARNVSRPGLERESGSNGEG